MALVLADRVKETTTTTGTGTYTLAGAVTGFESFATIGNTNTTYYCCTDGDDFEVGIGTYTASGTTLARTTILQSSNSDAAVNWTSGTRTIFCTQPAEKAVFLDANGDITLTGASYNLSEFMNFGDSGAPNFDNRLRFGDGVDLSLFSDGTNGFLQGANNNDLFVAYDEIHLLSQDYSKTRLKINSSDAVELYHDNVKKAETTADGVEISSTDDGASNEPILSLYRHSGSPADSDHAGTIQFNFQNDADQKTLGGRIYLEVDDVSDGSEDGAIKIAGLRGGSEEEYLELAFGLVRILSDALYLPSGRTILFEGSTNDTNETTLTVADPTADRTVTLPDATGTVLTTGNSDTPTTTTSSSDADFVLVDDGGTMKKITPANLGITAGAASTDDATALAIALG